MLDDAIHALLQLHGWPAYGLVFLTAALETAAFAGVIIPGETAVILGGVLVSMGRVQLLPMAAAGVLGAIVGDNIGYWLGRRVGARLLQHRVARLVGAKNWDRAVSYLERRGVSALLLGRFVAGVRTIVPGVAGMAKMPVGKFMLANALGDLIWGVTFTLVGFAAGRAWRRAAQLAGAAGAVILAVALLLALVGVVSRWIGTHPERVQAIAARVRANRGVSWLVRHLGREVGFLMRRFDPRAALGLRLTVSLVILAAAGWLLGQLMQGTIGGMDVARLDAHVARSMKAHGAPWLTTTAVVISSLGNPIAVYVQAAATALLWRHFRGTWHAALILAVALIGATALQWLLELVPSLRLSTPPAAGPDPGPLTSGTPASPALNAVVLYGVLAHVAGRAWPTWRSRVRAWTAALAIALLVTTSVVVLGVAFSDVLEGLALGTLWLALTLVALPARPPVSP